MARPRTRDLDLPRRVYRHHGAFYRVEKDGRWVRLGASKAEMYRNLAALEEPGALRTLSDVLDRYIIEVVPEKAPRTQQDNLRQAERLRAVFGHMRPGDVTTQHVYQYLDTRGRQSKVQANREIALLSHAYKKAIRWGAASENPCRGVEKHKERPRDRYVTDDEFVAVWEIASPMIRIAMELAVLTGLRQGDLLKLRLKNLTPEGIFVHSAKTGKRLVIEYSDELWAVLERAKKLRPIRSMYVLCTRHGQPYTSNGFSSIWRRTMDKAQNAGTPRYHFHDLRAKSGSDDTLAAAVARLGHSDQRTTARVYRRKPERVRPLR